MHNKQRYFLVTTNNDGVYDGMLVKTNNGKYVNLLDLCQYLEGEQESQVYYDVKVVNIIELSEEDFNEYKRGWEDDYEYEQI